MAKRDRPEATEEDDAEAEPVPKRVCSAEPAATEPEPKGPPDLLRRRNLHPHDARIEFFPKNHSYVIDGDRSVWYTSVTSFNGVHFAKYDVEKHAIQIMSKREYRNDPRFEFYKKSKDDIIDALNQNTIRASADGTALHYAIECYWNEVDIADEENYQKELGMFRAFVRDKVEDLVPFRTEWEIFDEDLLLAGSVDMVFERPDGQLLIYDWKRCRNLDDTRPFRFALTDCIKHMPDTKVAHYTLQLNTYKYIIEKNYGKKVAGMFLVGLHPDQTKYLHIEVPHIPDEMGKLLALRSDACRAKVPPSVPDRREQEEEEEEKWE